ncbi:MAG: prolyl oligopeptidase family serine peptidase, partial [Elusimicrobiota bacterium]
MGQEAALFASGNRPRSEDGGPMDADPYLWLEQVESTQALSWVRARNAESLAELSADPRFEPFRADIRSILNAVDRIPSPVWRGGLVHNFWQDSSHLRGLWRSASLEEYRKGEPAWRVLLDMDKLGREEGESWVWKGADCLPPQARRCLVSVSRGGKDAYEVREFDAVRATFTARGFRLREAKHRLAWMDEESLLIGTDFGPGSLTLSGYPRVLKSWRRGEPLEGAPLVFEGKESDVSVEPMSFFRPEGSLVLISRSVTYFESEFHRVLPGGKVRRLALPLDAAIEDWFAGKLLVRLLKDWTVGKVVFKAGALIAVPDDAYGEGDLAGRVELVYEPGLRSSLAGVWAVRGALYLLTRENVVSRLWAARREKSGWTLKAVSLPADGTVSMAAGDSFRDELFASYESFLVPSTLHLLPSPGAEPELLKRLPARFDASGLESAQFEAVSPDGTKVPYFLVSRKGMPRDGTTPVLLYGYGGFQIVYGPSYLQVPGKAWLEKGGAYALANIRGGGEFGPAWHQAALKEKRPRAFEDFIAVAEDIVARKVSEPRRLGIMGGSNGGL